MGHDANEYDSAQEIRGTLVWDGRVWSSASGEVERQALAVHDAQLGWRVRDGRLQRWDGAAWQTVAIASPPGGVLDWPVVSGEGADDAWVAGRPDTLSGVGEPGTPAYLAHWDGHRLTAVPAPAAAGGSPDGLLAVSPTEAWAAGCDARDKHGLIARWDGTAWHDERVPAGTGCLYQVVRAGGALYASGAGLLRLTSRGWRPVPGRPASRNGVSGLAADGSGGLWLATGDRYLHLHGGHWSSYPAPTGQGQALQAGGLTPVPGTGTVWAVASTSGSEEGIPDQAFIQRYDP
jgi:hypothetical protein